MSVTKLDAEDNTPIAGAVFGLYADEDIKNVDGKVIIEKGTLLEKATSDENGKIAFVKDYPFAKYVARELVKPAGYVTNEEVVNFDTKYQGQDVKTAVYNSEYKNTPTTFEFTKTDITSGAELTGATLTVLDKDGNVVDTWTSDAKEAHVIKRLVVGETYTLREEFAPYGYLKATDIQFTVEDKLCQEYGLSIIDVDDGNKEKEHESYKDWSEYREGSFVWADMIKRDLDSCILQAGNYEQFLELLSDKGYEVKQGKYLAVKPQGMTRFRRCKTLGEYVKALISQMDEVVAKINHQNERYDALNKKLSEIETSKDDEEVRGRLVKENQDKDALINSQQNELNKASSTIARLRDDIEKKDKEMKRMGDRIESLEDKIISVATENKNEAESKAEPQESQSVSQADKKMVDTVAVPQNMQAVANGIPVYYQIPVVDGTGNVVQRLPIERSVRKSSNSGVASLFARLSFKKRSRADIVRLVATGDLVPAQLVQIKSAIEKGLTESQLVELINNNISAEKMKEIIEIAVLENSMAD